MEQTVYTKNFTLTKMGRLDDLRVVEIYPNPNISRHRMEGVLLEPDLLPEDERARWKKLQAFEFKEKSLATVIDKNIDNANTALIIVHIQGSTASSTQEDALTAALNKNISIYAAFRGKEPPLEDMGVPKLPKNLQKHITMIISEGNRSSDNFFYGLSGNALWAKNENMETLKDELRKSWIKRVIVFGQALGQCVDSTILGLWRETSYEMGLLDMGIAIVTARNVIEPKSVRANSYFYFKLTPTRIEPSIQIILSADAQEEEENEDYI